MGESRSEPRRRAEVVVSTSQLDADVRFFQEVLGFRIESVFPADAPRITVMSGYGLTIRLDRSATCNPASLRLECEPQLLCKHEGAELVAPGGCHVRLVSNADALQLPSVCQTLELSRGGESACWGTGRTGMQYRDLISQREGGRFIASHIRIPGGGPVPDYVHYHKIRFQMIYCYHGWVRLSYEDQGPRLSSSV